MVGGSKFRNGSYRVRLAARLTLLLFILRAVIPVGYMPDLQALADGGVEIVICTPSGIETIRVGPDGRPIGPSDKKDNGQSATPECPFHAAFAHAFTVPDLAPLTKIARLASVNPAPASEDVPLPPANGPPLGSRAPPRNLV
ncbi:DUF2946 family protein [uncultured Nisaea sp.]|uniref:DUF2946 family protein n=1 Tax=uncultured Nisaea sp. TaxID=538215 RepID=UPI0030EC665D|tara:strand:- start:4482 stop:4907 length:426 start_codon:yes stop_codon:yes gene_type:complete